MTRKVLFCSLLQCLPIFILANQGFLFNDTDACVDFDSTDLEEFTSHLNLTEPQINAMNDVLNASIADLPFGSLQSDWSRLALLHDSLPDNSLLQTNFKRVFRTLTIAYLNFTQSGFQSTIVEESSVSSTKFIPFATENVREVESLLMTVSEAPTTIEFIDSDVATDDDKQDPSLATSESIKDVYSTEFIQHVVNLEERFTTAFSEELNVQESISTSSSDFHSSSSTSESEESVTENTEGETEDSDDATMTSKLSNKAQEYTELLSVNAIDATSSGINVSDMIRSEKTDTSRLLSLSKEVEVIHIEDSKKTNNHIINSTTLATILMATQQPVIIKNTSSVVTGFSGGKSLVKDFKHSNDSSQINPSTMGRLILSRKNNWISHLTRKALAGNNNKRRFKSHSSMAFMPYAYSNRSPHAAPISLIKLLQSNPLRSSKQVKWNNKNLEKSYRRFYRQGQVQKINNGSLSRTEISQKDPKIACKIA